MYTDVVECAGCGADVTIVLDDLQSRPTTVYCPGCTKLNAAKQQAFAPQTCKGCGVILKTYQLSPTTQLCPQCQLTQFAQAQATQSKARQRNVAYSKRTSGLGSTPRNYQGASAQSSAQCSFIWDVPRQAYSVTASYQPNFIEFIKAKVPVSDRVPEYDSITRKFKCWYIKEAWFDVLFELASQLWPNAVHTLTRQQAEDAWRAQEQARLQALAAQRAAVLGLFENALLDFCSICNLDALRAARNKMALSLHPDKGGDADTMARLNASWFIVETELKKRS